MKIITFNHEDLLNKDQPIEDITIESFPSSERDFIEKSDIVIYIHDEDFHKVLESRFNPHRSESIAIALRIATN